MITLDNLVMGYRGLRVGLPVSGTFQSGSLTAIIGANGTGKSTLLKTIAGLLPPVAGRVLFADGRRPRIAYLPQQAEMDRQFPVNVIEVVAMGCWPRTGLLRRIGPRDQRRVLRALERVGLSSLANRSIEALSGGQFQRMLFARLLVQEAPLVLLDEPFTGIDIQTCDLLLAVIEQLHRDGRTVLVVLHDHQQVARHFPETLLLSPECPVWGNSADVLSRWRGRTESRFHSTAYIRAV
ncbi:ABC transporter ATP-binding protein [Martelella alba]|uniref:ABC transporter ATP-binding protein n=2 Tax=Martelella alba TaxID=2590451 RepID=A0ABY2SPY1_9HYPH|nr:ABC transporter ATP-binding protein [Martelella alba]